MSRNAISANPEHYPFKIFRGSMLPDPLEGFTIFFSPLRGSKKIFRIDSPPNKNPRQNPDTLIPFLTNTRGIFHSSRQLNEPNFFRCWHSDYDHRIDVGTKVRSFLFNLNRKLRHNCWFHGPSIIPAASNVVF